MSVSIDRWTCPVCGVTELLEGSHDQLEGQRAAVQTGHAARHAGERRRSGPLTAALAEAAERIAAFRVRLVVAPADLARVRTMVVRRSLPVEVFADSALERGRGYVMTPRRGVRELSTPGDNPGDSDPSRRAGGHG